MRNHFYKFLVLIPTLFILNSSFLIHNCNCQWVQTSGPGSSYIQSLAVSGTNIFAGKFYNGVYFSTNNGTNWTQTALNNKLIWSLAVSGNNIFAGTEESGVYISTNNGTSWTQTALNIQSVNALAVGGNNIFAGTSQYGVYISTNNGTNWTQTTLNNINVYSLAVGGNNLFAGTTGLGVYLSTDNGTSWTQTALNNIAVNALAVSGNNIFAGAFGGNGGVYLSTNNGTDWTQIGLNDQNIYSLAVSGNNIFAGTWRHGVYLSTNNGVNWIERNEGYPTVPTDPSIYSLLITADYIFTGTNDYYVWSRGLQEALPVELASFTSIVSGRDIKLNWVTATEQNNSGFDIERKLISGNWTQIGFVKGKGTVNTPSKYSFEDNNLLTGKYCYRLKQIDYNGNFQYHNLISEVEIGIPSIFNLYQNYPNPFNPVTKINFDLSADSKVTLVVYDITGRRVAKLLNNEFHSAGYQTVEFDASSFTSGVYFYRLTTDGFSETKKMILMK